MSVKERHSFIMWAFLETVRGDLYNELWQLGFVRREVEAALSAVLKVPFHHAL